MFRKLPNEFPDLLKPTFSTAEVKQGVQHFISTKDCPVFARARSLAPDRLAIVKKEFAEMEKMGIIRKSTSPWVSPLHKVSKANGGWRPCGDYKKLNEIDSAFVYPDDFLIASSTEKEHLDDLKAVFRRLTDHGFEIRLEKCLFGVSSLEFLEHQKEY